MYVPDIIIAIDGYSSTGKSTFAKMIASELGFLYLDSGAMYRGVTLFAMENGWISDGNEVNCGSLIPALESLDIHFENVDGVSKTFMGSRCIEREIRSMPVSEKVSPIATVPQVRSYVDARLREMGKSKRVVMDGRDIGTTVFPNAELKIFMTAAPDVRAGRRLKELRAKGDDVTFEEVLNNLRERDRIDSSRKTSPLAKAEDAILLDNSEMTLDEQLAWVKTVIAERFDDSAKPGQS